MAKKPKKIPSRRGGRPAERAADGEAAGGKKKLIIMAAAAVVLLGGGGGGGYWFLIRSKKADDHGGGHGGRRTARQEDRVRRHEGDDGQPRRPEPPGSSERPRYLKIKISLEVSDPKIVAEVSRCCRASRTLPGVHARVAALRPRRLGRRLPAEGGVAARVNIAIHPAKVDAVLFKEILIQ